MHHERVAHSGLTLPGMGFGTWQLWGAEAVTATRHALDAGYRLIDSAMIYDNEGAVGKAIATSDVPRDDIIITSKLPPDHFARDRAPLAIAESVYRMGLDHIDLYLIHWPDREDGVYVEAWRALIEAKERGLVRAIGVSNFHADQLERLHAETGVMPEVNQIELHPYRPRRDLVALHEQHGIITEAWSPFGGDDDLLSDPVVTRIAHTHSASPAQVVLAWGLARGIIPLPKSGTPARQLENLTALELSLSEKDMGALSSLAK